MPKGVKFGGRAKGTVNKKTAALRAIAMKQVQSGVTPLEVMLDNMRFYHERANEILANILAGVGKRPSLEMIEALKSLCSFRSQAQDAASDAAPYMHPRLTAIAVKAVVDHNIKAVTGEMTPQQASEAYASTLLGDEP
jgi:hypothetical protein